MLAPTTGTKWRNDVRLIATFNPLSWQVAPWRDKNRVLLLTGSAGGGKSRLAAEKLHAFCSRYPGAFALIVRKTRVSMTKGTVLFLKESVIGADPGVMHLESKDYFRYRNGSILAYLGLEDEAQRERLKSIGPRGGVDIVWGEEATELEEADHNALLGRLRGPAAPWRQIIYTCNPDAPTHWLYTRLIQGGEAKVYYSGRADNTHNPADYDATMNSLTGIEDLRLNKGQWAQASGIVYDVWSDGPPEGNVTDAAEFIPDGGDVLWGVDDGYSGARDPHTGFYTAQSHPRVIGLYQLRHNGDLVRFAESYATQTLSEVQVAEVLALPYPAPEYAVVDSSAAELRGRLQEQGIGTYGGTHTVEEGIKVLRRFLAPDTNGHRRLRVHPRCTQFRAEMASYRYDQASGKPVKQFDHGPDEARMLAWHLRYE